VCLTKARLEISLASEVIIRTKQERRVGKYRKFGVAWV
jgi:hypothetical protein